jgi:hypothetical protein
MIGGTAVAVCSIGALSYTVVVVVYSSVQHILHNPQTLQDVEWGFNLNLGEASQALPVVRALTSPLAYTGWSRKSMSQWSR